MTQAPDRLTVERADAIVEARIVGEPTEDLVRECQRRVLDIAQATGLRAVLYDARAMDSPPVDVPLAQQALDAAPGALRLRRAIVVSSPRIAFLARLAFGDGDYRVFYDDADAARRWLAGPGPGSLADASPQP